MLPPSTLHRACALLIACIGWSALMTAQTTSNSLPIAFPAPAVPPPSNITIMPVGAAGTNFDAAVGSSVTWEYEALLPAGATPPPSSYTWSHSTFADAEHATYFTFTPGGANNSRYTITYTPNGDIACAAPPSLTITATHAGHNAGNLNLTYCATGATCDPTIPIDIVLVVDVSGSMGDPASCGLAGETKLTFLKNKMMNLYDAIAAQFMRGGTDRFGLVTFHTTQSPVMGLQTIAASTRTTLAGHMDTSPAIDGLQPQDWTGMGLGLHEAYNMLLTTPLPPGAPATRKKLIILVTNGSQNIDPMVTSTGVPAWGAFPARSFNHDIQVVPYAIFSPSESYVGLLNDILNNTGGSEFGLASTPLVCNIGQPMAENWVGALKSYCSPKLVAFRSNTPGGTSGQENFTVNEVMSRLSVNVSASGEHSFSQFKLEKMVGGVPLDLSPYGTFTPPLATPSKHRVFTVDFPIASAPAGFTSVGDYRASFTSTVSGLRYDFSAIVDDAGIRHRFFANGIAPAGDRYYLGAQLLQDNKPISNATVKAILYAPRAPLGAAFSKKKVPGQFISVSNPHWGRLLNQAETKSSSTSLQNPVIVVSPGHKKDKASDAYIKQFAITHPTLNSFKAEGNRLDNGEKKYLVLMYETDFPQVFDLHPIATIPLQHVGNGVYRATYDGFKKTGLYRVRFEATGTTSVAGDFARFEDKDVLVRFGTPDRSRSELCLMYEEPPVLSMRPVDTEGNPLGPNQTNVIDLQVDGKKITNITDYLDGRYVVALNSPAADPRVVIRIHHRILYDGPLSDLCTKRGYAEITGGVTSPAQVFDQNYNPGWAIQGRLGYRVWKQVGVQIKGGYYAFSGGAPNVSSTGIFGAGGGLSYRYWLNVLYGLYAQADVNAMGYKPKSNDWAFGLNYGLGLTKPLSHKAYLVVRGDYHDVQTSPDRTQFFSYSAGFQFRF